MLRGIVQQFKKLKENEAFPLLLHPKVLANYVQHMRERRDRPVVMKSFPPQIEIELTNRCNLACIQCLRSKGLRPYALGDMDLVTYKRVLAQFPYLMNLSLNGFGEALLHKQFFEIVRYSRAKMPWIKIGIYSNGMPLDEAKANEIIDCGLTEMNVSIDAAEPATYQRVRRGGDLETVHQNIRRLVQLRRQARARLPLIGTNFVMLNENEGELVRFVEQSAELGVDFVNCITYATYDWGFENRRSPESYRRELDAARKRMEVLGVRCKYFPSDDLAWSQPERRFACPFFWGENFRVTYAGHVTLGCCTPFKETYSYGNVLETPFQEIWNNALFRQNRELARQGKPPHAACVSCDRFAKQFFAPRAPEQGGRTDATA